MRIVIGMAALLSAAVPATVHGQESSPQSSVNEAARPLTLQEVLRSSARSAPEIIAALARNRQAEARALTAQGAFDTVFAVEARSRTLGYYDGTEIAGKTEQPLSNNGGYVYGQYRASRGDFPIYEDKSYTNRLGELKVGGLYSLLRDRLIDARRSEFRLAANDIDIARFETRATSIGVQARAVEAYQKWVAAGLKLKAYEALLALAGGRTDGIERQVQLGAKPDILLTENEANLVRRQAFVDEARQDFRAAAVKLSLYYRSADGTPVVVDEARLPADANALDGIRSDPAFNLEGRPDFAIMLEEIDKATVKLALARNDLMPRLDLGGEVAKDVGPAGLGGTNRTPLEMIVGITFKIPLQNRKAKGKLAETRAKIDELSVKQQFLAEKIRAEVTAIGIEVDTANQLVATTEKELVLAQRLASAERRRFALGSSDFFLVNQREESATNAEVKLIEAQARTAAARAELAAATADEDALGLAAISE
ncbi:MULTISPECIES: TolC family protein [unclassified Sphingobium]|uniref:TolC family protein n=2 Tax=unclassified Sphingobium TaxID=2611147 RepID=UPI000D172863|nr:MULTISPECIES: TolC family protein [unclassified Sphingobium]MBG6120608.1 outer membrane protein TolC [Sphingobium sp. JAI105]TWD26151.1 outer membrane efflux protein [Sphingobium sp. AEW001]PSO11937.1 multidrug transporter [Sphingobium sp. AEW4]TWD06699.1 outer membrane efflux protein [Sphingobium sp. AEW010]TWD23632.1 outer membrane efflux protein [Sphingobium sp. AEW013]